MTDELPRYRRSHQGNYRLQYHPQCIIPSGSFCLEFSQALKFTTKTDLDMVRQVPRVVFHADHRKLEIAYNN